MSGKKHKRKHRHSSRDKENDYLEEILTKIRKLEEKMEAKENLDSSKQSDIEINETANLNQALGNEQLSVVRATDSASESVVAVDNVENNTESTPQTKDSEKQNKTLNTDKEKNETSLNIDLETLKLLGDDPTAKDVNELKLNSNVTSRITNWMTNGVPKELKDTLLLKFPKKGNCNIEVPELNEEIAINLNETAIKRDNHFKEMHNLIASALSASATATSMLIEDQNIDKIKLTQYVLGSTQLLTELYYVTSNARKAFIVPGFDKKTKKVFEKTTTGKFLFGENFSDKVKEVRAVEKVGEELKAPTSKKVPLKGSNNLNYKSSAVKTRETAPSNYRRGNSRAFVSYKRRPQASYAPARQTEQQKSRSQVSRR